MLGRLRSSVFRSGQLSRAVKVLVYRACVLSVLLYGAAESWALSASQLQRLHVVHMAGLRCILGVSRLDHISNDDVLRRTGMESMEELLRGRRLQWLGHLARMPDDRWPKQLLFAQSAPEGLGRRVGGRLSTWVDLAHQDVQSRLHLLPEGVAWYVCAQNRELWQKVTRGA